MSKVAQIAEIAGVSTADVVRVARQGGTSARDWDIAAAIEAAGGRPAAETMWSGHTREARHTPQAAPANPEATRERSATIYAEDANELVSDIPESRGTASETSESEEVAEFAHSLHSDLAAYARSKAFAAHAVRVVAATPTLSGARQALYRRLATDKRTDLFGLHPEPVALAA